MTNAEYEELSPESRDIWPDNDLMPAILAAAIDDARIYHGTGKVANYIPALQRVDPNFSGVAIATCTRRVFHAGAAEQRFSIQSISKLFTLVIALQLVGDEVWKRVGRAPSIGGFNNISELERGNGIPRNPFLNAGALVITDIIVSHSAAPHRQLIDFLRRQTGTDDIFAAAEVAKSEAENGHRNAAIAHLLKDLGNLQNNVEDVLSVYFSNCSIEMNCVELAKTALFLTNKGIQPDTKQPVLALEQVREVNALLSTSGLYDSSADFAFRIGLPAKSGVGGGILAIVPNRMAVCAWSPELDMNGNSIVGQKIIENLSRRMKLSIY